MKKFIFTLIFFLTAGEALAQALPVMNRIPEDWEACGTATSSTSNVAIKAALTNAFIYVTGISCQSSDADNSTDLNFKDGTTVISVGGVNQMAATSSGTFTDSFLTPLKVSKNTAFNFNTAVSTASVVCCARGYVSNQ